MTFACAECDDPIFYRRRKSRSRSGNLFCSRSCAARFNNRVRNKQRYGDDDVFKVNPEDHIGLVHFIAKKFIPRRPRRFGDVSVTDTDQYQDGCVGLVLACLRFDSSKGVKFSAFACKYIKGYVLWGCSDWKRLDVADAYLGDDRKIVSKIA